MRKCNIEEFRSWLIDQIADEDKLGNKYNEFREFDNGLMSAVHYQRSAAFQITLTKLMAWLKRHRPDVYEEVK